MNIQKKYWLLLLLITLFANTFGQQQQISYSASNKPLSLVLSDISEAYSVKFAFDSDLFQQIETTIVVKNIGILEFLRILEADYSILSRYVDGTWVLLTSDTMVKQYKQRIQPGKALISGFIKDKITKENLVYCNVAYGSGQGTITNKLGFFSFQAALGDSIKILISHLGYKKTDTIAIAGRQMNIMLTPAEYLMPDVVISEVEKNILSAAPQPEKIALNPVKALGIPRIADDDLGNVALLIPGVNFLQGSAAGLSIRGSAPTDNLVLFDGIPVLETSHLLGNMSVINARFVQQAFVSRGGFDAAFGGRVAGLIELTGKSGKNDHAYLDISANLLNTNAIANIPITPKLSVTAAWRRSLIDSWKNYLYLRLIDNEENPAISGNPVSSTILPTLRYQDLNTKISFHPKERLEVNLNMLYGNDDQSRNYELANGIDYYRNENVASTTIGFSLNCNMQVNQDWFSSVSAGYSQLKYTSIEETGSLEEISAFPPNFLHSTNTKWVMDEENNLFKKIFDVDNGRNNVNEFRFDWKNEVSVGKHQLQAGIEWTANAFSFDYFANRVMGDYPVDSIMNSEKLYLFNTYFQQHIAVTPKLKMRLGLRATLNMETLKPYLQPRAGIEYNTGNGITCYYSSGIYHQFLTRSKRIDSEGRFNYVWYLPNTHNEGMVKGFHQIAGIRIEKKGWMANFEGYLKNNSGKMNLFAETQNSGNESSIIYLPRKSSEKFRGFDLMIQKKQNIFNHMLGYSLSKASEKMENIMNDEWYPAYNDRVHRLKITEMVTWKNWSLSGSWHFSSGLPVLNLAKGETPEGIERSTNFSQLDFALTKRVFIRHFWTIAGVSLLNVLDRKNIVEVNYLRFTSDTGSLALRSDVSALGFTPVFFVNFKIQ
ncbi:MAG: hypothetical protein CSA36_07150 [Draconibacterium sp.]|nr:MAG: hypothetical protein CSA36_07150 [Draconibacterium sp.]